WDNCASFADGTVKCWGLNNMKQLGQNSGPFVLAPFTIAGVADVMTVGWTSGSAAATMMASGRAIATNVGTGSITAVSGSLTAVATLTVVNTSTGSNVVVRPVDTTMSGTPVEISFAAVAQPGSTTLTTSTSGPGAPPGFEVGNPPVYLDVSTTALYSPPVTICVSYAGATFTSQPQLFLYESGSWVD